jgi:dTDP-4-dehydrorhamnose 3,5-epimerase
MKVTQTTLSGLLVLEPDVHHDERGWFMESFNQRVLDEAVGHRVEFVQDNHSFSIKGVVRGLHYQLPPHAQGKLIRVLRGVIWDVAVDIRKNSVTFGQWFGLELSTDNRKQLWLPQGFAHGFVVLSESAELAYKCTAYYAPQSERRIAWNDTHLNINWPKLNGTTVSQQDAAADAFGSAMVFD